MQTLSIASLDLFLRAAAIGQVLLVVAVHLRFPADRHSLSLLGVALCLVAQLLLGSPGDVSGGLRHLLLTLTDASAYAVWFAALSAIDDRFAASRWPASLKIALAAVAMWHLYFFGVLGGDGIYHAVNHLAAVVLLSHVIVVAVRGWRDDLVDVRRRTRLLIVGAISAYGIVLAATQLIGDAWRGGAIFGLVTAALSFAGTLLFGRFLLLRPMQPAAAPTQPTQAASPDPAPPLPAVPAELQALNTKLDAFIHQRGHLQSGLGIAELAAALGCTEHRLRRLINGGLGYRNFSDFLNQHRVEEARRLLADPAVDTPVLTMRWT